MSDNRYGWGILDGQYRRVPIAPQPVGLLQDPYQQPTSASTSYRPVTNTGPTGTLGTYEVFRPTPTVAPIATNPPIVPVSDAAVGDVISIVPEDQQIGVPGQDYQYYNPDIDYTDPYIASNNQIVGTLPDGTASASDFQIGASQQPTDFVTDYTTDTTPDIAVNPAGATVDIGYGVGEVDPALADAAGYTPVGVTPSTPPVFVDETPNIYPAEDQSPIITPAIVPNPDLDVGYGEGQVDPALASAVVGPDASRPAPVAVIPDGPVTVTPTIETTTDTPSDYLTERLQEREGFRTEAYLDTEGNWTIGYGTTSIDGRPVQEGDTITQEQAQTELNKDIQTARQDAVRNIDNFDNLSPALQDALTNQAYQLGGQGQAGFQRMIDAINRGDYDAAADEALNSRWAEQTPVRAEDLANSLRAENIPAIRPEARPTALPAWQEAGYSDEYKYDNRIDTSDWSTPAYLGGDTDIRYGYNEDGEYVGQYRVGDTVYDSYDEAQNAKETAQPTPEWETAGYTGEFAYNNRLDAEEWATIPNLDDIEKRSGYTADGSFKTQYKYGDQVFDNSSDATAAKTNASAAERAEAEKQTEWYQAGYNSQHTYDNRLDADPWESSPSGSWDSRSGWTPEGEYKVEYRIGDLTYDDTTEALDTINKISAAKTTANVASYTGSSQNVFENPNTGQKVAIGYGEGQIDPALARAAGYTSQVETAVSVAPTPVSTPTVSSYSGRDDDYSAADAHRDRLNEAAARSYTGSNQDYTSSRVSDFSSSGNWSRGFAQGGMVGLLHRRQK